MRVYLFAAALSLTLLPSAVLAQASPPSWECQTTARGERSCRAIWDSRDKSSQPMIHGNDEDAPQRGRSR